MIVHDLTDMDSLSNYATRMAGVEPIGLIPALFRILDESDSSDYKNYKAFLKLFELESKGSKFNRKA